MRSVSVQPGATLFTVMPNGPNSFESVFASPVVPARTEFESTRPSIGSFTAVDVMLMMRARSDFVR